MTVRDSSSVINYMHRVLVNKAILKLVCPRPTYDLITFYVIDLYRKGHYKMMGGVCPSVYLSVACLDPT